MRDILVIATHIYGALGSLYGSLFFLVTAWQLLVIHGDPCSFLGWALVIGGPLSMLAAIFWPLSIYLYGFGAM